MDGSADGSVDSVDSADSADGSVSSGADGTAGARTGATSLEVRPIGPGAYAYANTYLFVFTTFAEAFGVRLSEATVEDLKVLLPGMETTEKTLGKIRDPEERAQFVKAVLDFLRHDGPCFRVDAGDADDIQRALREAARRRGVLDRFADMLEAIFAQREIMRTTTDKRAFLAARLEDGVLAADFAQLFVDEQPNRRKLAEFKVLVSKMFNLVDTLLDAKDDFAEGQMALKPTPGFYWTLFVPTVGLFLSFFAKVPSVSSLWKVTRFVIGYEIRMTREKRAKAQALLTS